MRLSFIGCWRLMYFVLLGHLLLLTSAVYERGETEFSRLLVPEYHMVPQMLEALLASMTVLVVWAFLYCYIRRDR